MPDLTLDIQWQDAPDIQGPELAATWCDLTIRVDNEPITRIYDARAKTVRDYIALSAYPLAEWFAINWWFLIGEYDSPSKSNSRSFQQRHDISYSGQGYELPSLSIVPTGKFANLTWRSSDSAFSGNSFLSSGKSIQSLENVRASIAEFISTICIRLQDHSIKDTFLQEEWNAIEEASPSDRRLCLASAAVGWDAFSITDARATKLRSIHDQFGSDFLLNEVLQVSTIALLDNIGVILDKFDRLAKTRTTFGELALLKNKLRKIKQKNMAIKPWEQGYHDARHVRSLLGLNGKTLANTRELARTLGEKPIRVSSVFRHDEGGRVDDLIGFLVIDGRGCPKFSVEKTHPNSRTFQFCRALGAFLSSDERRSVITMAHSDHQARFRAFAAEFLVPSHDLRKEVTDSVVNEYDLERLGAYYGVSTFVVRHQLENHGIADFEYRKF